MVDSLEYLQLEHLSVYMNQRPKEKKKRERVKKKRSERKRKLQLKTCNESYFIFKPEIRNGQIRDNYEMNIKGLVFLYKINVIYVWKILSSSFNFFYNDKNTKNKKKKRSTSKGKRVVTLKKKTIKLPKEEILLVP